MYVKPPSPRLSAVSVLGVNGGLVVGQPVLVQQFDIYEPNDTTPWNFGTNAIANPGAAFESRGRDDFREPTDWYTFTTDGGEDRTIIVGGKGLGSETFSVFLTDSMYSYGDYLGYYVGYNAWTIGPSTYFCGGIDADVTEEDFPLATVALRDLPAGTYHAVVFYTPQPDPNAYSIVVAKSYVSALDPDDSEENDFCNVAPSIPSAGTTLTIDVPHDPDWFRFSVPAGGRTFTLDVAAADSLADLDVYVFADSLPLSLPLYALGFAAGQTESVSAFLDEGDYFLLIVDYPGRTTTYTMSAVMAAPPVGAAPAVQRISPETLEAVRAHKRAGMLNASHTSPLRSGRR